MCISTGNSDSIFFWQLYPFLNLEIWPKLHILLKTVRQGNSIETAQQNFMKLFSYEGHNMKICIFTGNAVLICLKSNLYPFELWPKLFCATWMNWFSVWLLVTNAWNCHSLYTAFSSNVGPWGMWACSLFLSLSLVQYMQLYPLTWFTCSHSLEIVKARFDDYAVKKQDFLGDEEKQKKVLSLITDENILL